MTANFVNIATDLHTQVEEGLQKLFTAEGLLNDLSSTPESFVEPLRYALLAGGKRLRPVLCLAACQAVSGDAKTALPAALAIEILHNYTLVHDDMPCMDNDLLRRGRPTVHAKFGYAQAVLVGDALQAAAFQCLDKTNAPAEVKCRLFRELANAAGPGGVVGGQWYDVCRPESMPIDSELINYVHRYKTGELIRCALVMGAVCGGASEDIISHFSECGYAFGCAFQLLDDLLDGEEGMKENELSILRICSVEEARTLALQMTEKALGTLDSVKQSFSDPARLEAISLLRSLFETQLKRNF